MAVVRRSIAKETPPESSRPRQDVATSAVQPEAGANIKAPQPLQLPSSPEKTRLMPEPDRGEDSVSPKPMAVERLAETPVRVLPAAGPTPRHITEVPKTMGIAKTPEDLPPMAASAYIPKVEPPPEITFLPPSSFVQADEAEGSAPVKSSEPAATPKPARISLKVEKMDTALPIAKARLKPELSPGEDNGARNDKPQSAEEQPHRPTLVPPVALPTAATPESRSEQRVTVHIGAIEIRALPRQQVGEQPVRPASPPPAPAGFDGFTRLRSYASWLP